MGKRQESPRRGVIVLRPDPLSVVCPRCASPVGVRCTDYLGRFCAPHRERCLCPVAAEKVVRTVIRQRDLPWEEVLS